MGQIIQYADADASLKARMDDVIQAIENDPLSFQAVIAYGGEAVQAAGLIATALVGYAPHCDALKSDFKSASGASISSGLTELGALRAQTSANIDMYIGAASEVLRRYDEVYIPAAQALFDNNKTPDNADDLRIQQQRRDDFINRIAILQGTSIQLSTSDALIAKFQGSTAGSAPTGTNKNGFGAKK